ncbi:hypothetical protein Cgig2_017952 [Carnegiea gigantea]|uniref:Uncharacterized protein n=1 Tax=Carnegiea gigantea TaxID=171969 RepID=A0A9Q1QEB1_9CARY|nr:hypothetical protein Cgig2_017952 [Carnegiea gigantea]
MDCFWFRGRNKYMFPGRLVKIIGSPIQEYCLPSSTQDPVGGWSTCSPYASDSKRKQSVLLDTNVSKDKGKLASKPKLKIVRSGKPSEPFVSMMEDGSSHFKIPGIDVVIPVTPIPTVPIQSITPLPQDGLPIGVCELSTEKVIELPPEGAKNIMDILDVEPNLTECMVSRAPFDGLPSLKGDFDSLYATILQRGVNVTPLESKVEGLIKQACEFIDLQQSYSSRTSTA